LLSRCQSRTSKRYKKKLRQRSGLLAQPISENRILIFSPFLFIYQQKKTRANEIPRLKEYEEIGLAFDGNMLIDYDGVFSLPSELVSFLKVQGYDMSFAE
jgi:hypothetical protein